METIIINNNIFTDREGAFIPVETENYLRLTQSIDRLEIKPKFGLKQQRFRKRFDRHQLLNK